MVVLLIWRRRDVKFTQRSGDNGLVSGDGEAGATMVWVDWDSAAQRGVLVLCDDEKMKNRMEPTTILVVLLDGL